MALIASLISLTVCESVAIAGSYAQCDRLGLPLLQQCSPKAPPFGGAKGRTVRAGGKKKEASHLL
jgi:hypothetical protein